MLKIKEILEYLAIVIVIPAIIVLGIFYVIDNYQVITDPYVYNYTKIVNEDKLKDICDVRKSPEITHKLGYNGDFDYTYRDLKASYVLHLDNRKTPLLLNILSNDFGNVYTVVVSSKNGEDILYRPSLRFDTNEAASDMRYTLVLKDKETEGIYILTDSKMNDIVAWDEAYGPAPVYELRLTQIFMYGNEDNPIYSFFKSDGMNICTENKVPTDKKEPDFDAIFEQYEVLIDSRDYYGNYVEKDFDYKDNLFKFYK